MATASKEPVARGIKQPHRLLARRAALCSMAVCTNCILWVPRDRVPGARRMKQRLSGRIQGIQGSPVDAETEASGEDGISSDASTSQTEASGWRVRLQLAGARGRGLYAVSTNAAEAWCGVLEET